MGLGREGNGMLLIEKILGLLVEQDLVATAEEFSTDWCCKSRSWYAERKHSRRDFSVTAAISCLDTANRKLMLLRMRQKRMGGLLQAEIAALGQIEDALRAFLHEQHRITEVALSKTGSGKML